jgi:hypothetical protein
MSIKFVCSCGKRLKARDDMAGKRIPCPRCGNPIGVPSLDPDKPTPMTPAERLRHQARRPITLSHLDEAPGFPVPEEARSQSSPETRNREVAANKAEPRAQSPALGTEYSVLSTQYSESSAPLSPAGVPTPRPLDPTTVRLKKERKHQRHYTSRFEWPLETHWYECAWYPFRAWPLVLVLAAVLTVLTAAVALVLPRVLAEMPLDAVSVPVGLVSLVPLLALLGYVCAFLDCVLAAGMAGEARHVRWPGRDLGLIFRSFVAWVLAFASVPAPLAVIGFYYWLYAGDLQLVDWIILAELGVVGSGYWLLAVLAVCRSERLRDANPWRVAELAERLGWRSLVVAVMAGLLFLSHGLLAFWIASVLHDQLALGLSLAAACWLSWLYWATFVFRVVGVWWHYRQKNHENTKVRKHEKGKE